MLEPKDVVGKARVYLGEILPDFAALQPQVEEMVLDQQSDSWMITFAALGHEENAGKTLADLLKVQKLRKVVRVGAEDGVLLAVRNPVPF